MTTPSTPTADVQQWLDQFSSSLDRRDFDGVMNLFGTDAYWRDLVSFTWNLTTAEGPSSIRAMLEATVPLVRPSNWHVAGEASASNGVVEGWLLFETTVGRGKGHVRLINGRCWTLLTTLQELKGFEEATGDRRPKGIEHGVHASRSSWGERRSEAQSTLGVSEQPYVAIIGGGHGGIVLGARLQKLGVPTLVLDRHARPGDNWRTRYRSLTLHDPVWYDHLPYLPFPEDWPVFSPKDKLADWLEMYATVMEVNYWAHTECRHAVFDEAEEQWVLQVRRGDQDLLVRPVHLVLATGLSGRPQLPNVPGMNTFVGTQQHSSQFRSGSDWTGKKAVVVGSSNSAHDIAAELWEAGADVTMVQRSSTFVGRSETLMELALGPLYSEAAVNAGVSTEIADLIFASIPYRLLGPLQTPVYEQIKERDRIFYEQLAAAGFQVDFGEDGSGLFLKYLRRGSGYYIDVGASELIIDGRIKLRHGEIDSVTSEGLRLTDGTALPAHLIVYATGYGEMSGIVDELMGREIADKVGRCWGLGSGTTKDPGPWEGELRNMWKPTKQRHLWFQAGNLHQARHYSKCLALQLKARMEGLATPVYEDVSSHASA